MTPTKQGTAKDGKMIDDLVNRFLAWPLPSSVCSDDCACTPNYPHRSGTTLLTADEAKQMFTDVAGSLCQRLLELDAELSTSKGAAENDDYKQWKNQKYKIIETLECSRSTQNPRAAITEVLVILKARCLCGGVILADTEDWAIPLCCNCYEAVQSRE